MRLLFAVFIVDTRKSSETLDLKPDSITRFQSPPTYTGNKLVVVCTLFSSPLHFELKGKVKHNIFLAFLARKIALILSYGR